MRFVISALLLLFPLSFLTGAVPKDTSSLCIEGPIPEWVKECLLDWQWEALEPFENNTQELLDDLQVHLEEKTAYNHHIVKALNQSGVREVAQLEIEFDPEYSKVVMHRIQVIRNGVYLDRLHSARCEVLQREEELEQDLFQGHLTVVYFLEDIREGDIVECAYSVVGELPCFSSRFAGEFPLQGLDPIHRLYLRLLAHPTRQLTFKSFHTDVMPEIVDLSSGLREWSWECMDVAPYSIEESQPDLFAGLARVQISEYQDWQEVIGKLWPMFALSQDESAYCSPEMAELVEEWKNTTSDPNQCAVLALRFVQDQVRYLGFEEGESGFIPRNPKRVFQRRFGDCKDKVYLLHALLRTMGISSTPVLVNAIEGKSLIDSLPSPGVFNHVILMIEIEGTRYWVDATVQNQGGIVLRDNFFPTYHWGLPIAADAEGLVALPSAEMQKPMEISTNIVLESQDSAVITSTWIMYGLKADSIRGYLTHVGLKNLSEDALRAIQKVYGKGSLNAPMTIMDDRENNVLTLIESYRVPTQMRSGKKVLKVYSFTLRGYLDKGVLQERSVPYSLYYPAWVKEHIHVENSFTDWNEQQNSLVREHPSLYFSHSYRMQGHSADFDFELKHQKDHISVETIPEYCELVDEIQEWEMTTLPIAKIPAKAA